MIQKSVSKTLQNNKSIENMFKIHKNNSLRLIITILLLISVGIDTI